MAILKSPSQRILFAKSLAKYIKKTLKYPFISIVEPFKGKTHKDLVDISYYEQVERTQGHSLATSMCHHTFIHQVREQKGHYLTTFSQSSWMQHFESKQNTLKANPLPIECAMQYFDKQGLRVSQTTFCSAFFIAKVLTSTTKGLKTLLFFFIWEEWP